MEFHDRRRYFNLCNPDEPLEPGDERNVAIDNPSGELDQPRGANWVDRLASRLELSQEPVCEFFTGLPGSGKSTELRRLAARLRDPKGAHLLAVLVDAEEVLDVSNPVDVPDVLVALLYSADRAVLVAEGQDPEHALEDGYLPRFWHWLTTTEVAAKSIEGGVEAKTGLPGAAEVGASAKAVLEMKTSSTFRRLVRDKVAAHMTSFLAQAREEAKALEERAKGRGYNGLLLILDSLEKLRGISTNWTEVLASAERLFAGDAPYLRLPVHTVYTIPPALVLRLSVPVNFMPMLKLHDRQTGARALGYDAARKIVARRLPEAALQQVFGAPFEARVEELILWSGGYPREIVRLLQNCVAQAPLTEPLFKRLLSQAGDAIRRTVPENAFGWLAKVSLDKRLAISDANREIADLMLSNSVVLRYQNDAEWFDLHPALRDFPEIEAEKDRIAGARKTLVG